jgi:RimJ/RimL family protein N-acetyltransferase
MRPRIRQRQALVLDDGRRVVVRPLQAADREVYADAVASLSARSRYLRFASPVARLGEQQLDLMTHADGRRHVAYIALTPDESVGVGVVRYVRSGAANRAEIAIAVADDWQGHGLGRKLLSLLIEHAAAAGVDTLFAVTLRENGAARGLARDSGFAVSAEAGIQIDYERAVVQTVRAVCATGRARSSRRGGCGAATDDPAAEAEPAR